jgi:hypothetical protein
MSSVCGRNLSDTLTDFASANSLRTLGRGKMPSTCQREGVPGRWVAFLIDNHGMTYGPAPNDLYKIEKGVSVRLVSEVNHNDETVYL